MPSASFSRFACAAVCARPRACSGVSAAGEVCGAGAGEAAGTGVLGAAVVMLMGRKMPVGHALRKPGQAVIARIAGPPTFG